MKSYFSLVVSVCDECGNRIDAKEITGSNSKKQMLSARENLVKEITEGKYDSMKYGACTLRADIEVHNNDTWELLYLM